MKIPRFLIVYSIGQVGSVILTAAGIHLGIMHETNPLIKTLIDINPLLGWSFGFVTILLLYIGDWTYKNSDLGEKGMKAFWLWYWFIALVFFVNFLRELATFLWII